MHKVPGARGLPTGANRNCELQLQPQQVDLDQRAQRQDLGGVEVDDALQVCAAATAPRALLCLCHAYDTQASPPLPAPPCRPLPHCHLAQLYEYGLVEGAVVRVLIAEGEPSQFQQLSASVAAQQQRLDALAAELETAVARNDLERMMALGGLMRAARAQLQELRPPAYHQQGLLTGAPKAPRRPLLVTAPKPAY
jgi:hypothetical protein